VCWAPWCSGWPVELTREAAAASSVASTSTARRRTGGVQTRPLTTTAAETPLPRVASTATRGRARTTRVPATARTRSSRAHRAEAPGGADAVAPSPGPQPTWGVFGGRPPATRLAGHPSATRTARAGRASITNPCRDFFLYSGHTRELLLRAGEE